MKKKNIILLSFIFLLLIKIYFVSGFNIEVEEITKKGVIISELDDPAIFDFIINNKEESDSVEIFSLIGVKFSPVGTFNLPEGRQKIEVIAYIPKEIRKNENLYLLEYQIKGSQGIYKDVIPVRVVSLENLLEFNNLEITPGEKKTKASIKNLYDLKLEKVNIKFDSEFLEFSDEFNFESFEAKEIELEIAKDTAGLSAGSYINNIEVSINEVKTETQTDINYIAKELISTDSKSKGFIIREKTITKKNEGSLPSIAKIEVSKDIISRLVTSFSISPDTTERGALSAHYTWEKEMLPGEEFSVITTTNYTLPFIALILIIIIALAVKYYSVGSVNIKKSVSLVKTKGGEFALKVTIKLKARKNLRNVAVQDRLSAMTKIYERYGRKPDKIDEASRLLLWNIGSLNKGESRVFSYIIYSKLRAVGRFELPLARVEFADDKGKSSALSNKAYFASETADEN